MAEAWIVAWEYEGVEPVIETYSSRAKALEDFNESGARGAKVYLAKIELKRQED
jgi:hypothetical protein